MACAALADEQDRPPCEWTDVLRHSDEEVTQRVVRLTRYATHLALDEVCVDDESATLAEETGPVERLGPGCDNRLDVGPERSA